MVAPHPDAEARKASELYDELKRLAASMVQDWKGAGIDGEFGDALLRITSRMGAHVTQRISKTPRRDSVEFYNMLDIPAGAPVPAEVPLVFLLNDQTDAPVFAAAGVQVSASTDDGEIVFETEDDARLTPARLEFLASVNGDDDRIDQAPDQVRLLEPPADTALEFEIVSFSELNSKSLQLEPIEGLVKGDYLQIGDAIYQLDPNEDPTDGLVELTEALKTEVGPTRPVSTATKVRHLAAFQLPDLQAHDLYIGHSEMLNLANPALIQVIIEPDEVIDNLPTGLEWQLWGTKGGQDEPDWHELEVCSGDTPGSLSLKKTWTGSVDALSVGGQESLWLRAHLTEEITGEKIDSTRVSAIQICVATLDEDEASSDSGAAPHAHCADFNTVPKSKPDSPEDGSDESKALSITQAFHNGTPLPLTTRFFPFGPEPQRFDTFSIAAPEALSKKGAKVKLDVSLPDASVANIAVTRSAGAPLRAYAIGHNGELQQLLFDGDSVYWRRIGSPQPEDLDEEGQEGRLDLDPTGPLQAVELKNTSVNQNQFITDLTVMRDRSGRTWSVAVRTKKDDSRDLDFGSWQRIPAAPGNEQGRDFELLRRNDLPTSKEGRAVLLSIGDDQLHQNVLHVGLEKLTVAPRRWTRVVSTAASTFNPVLDPATRLVPVFDAQWPVSPQLLAQEVMVLDQNGIAIVGETNTISSTIEWHRFADLSADDISSEATPSSARLSNGDLIAFFAKKLQPDRQELGAVVVTGDVGASVVATPAIADFALLPGGEFQCFPEGYGDEPLTIAVGTVPDGASGKRKPAIAIWAGTSDAEISSELPNMPADPALQSARIMEIRDFPAVVLGGRLENLYVQNLAERVGFELYHAVRATGLPAGSYYVEPNAYSGALPIPVAPLPANPIDPSAANSVYALPASTHFGSSFNSTDWTIWETGATNQGKRHSGNNRHFEYGSAAPPAVGSKFIINNELYTVSNPPAPPPPPPALPADHVWVDADLPSATFNYTEVSEYVAPGLTVASSPLASLVNLFDLPEPESPPDKLTFTSTGGAPTPDPDIQQVNMLFRDGESYWALLSDPWATIPGNQSSAFATGISGSSWTAVEYQRGYENPDLAWEYFDGESWRRLEITYDTTFQFARSGTIAFTVPKNLEQGEVAGQEDYWVRARLVGGDYGSVKYNVNVEFDNNGNPVKQAVDVDRSGLQPPEILKIDVSFEITTKIDPEVVLTYNNLTFRNQTKASAKNDASFEIFEGVRAINNDGAQQVIYLGLTQRFSGGPLTLFVDADDTERDTRLTFEVRGERGWHSVSSDDGTAGFHRRGFVHLSIDTETRRARYFNRELHWLRVRPETSDPGWQPSIRGIYLNGVRSLQAKSLAQEIVGSSTGEPEQKFLLAEHPAIPESLELRVRESLTEEERLALNRPTEGLDDDEQVVTNYRDTLSIDGDWVRWTRVDSFLDANEGSRVYRLDAEAGRIEFGADTRIPPAGANGIRAIRYKSGGGENGNQPAFSIESTKSSIQYLEKVYNPVASSGGTDTPSLDDQLITAPGRLRHQDLALTRPDIEAIAVATSPDVVSAKCMSPSKPGDPIRIAIAVRTGARCPQPTIARKLGITRAIQATAWGALDERDIRVEAPEYWKVKLDIELRPASVEVASGLEERATQALRLLTHPVAEGCGPRGNGWAFGRSIFDTDVLRVVSQIDGFDRVKKLKLRLENGDPVPEQLPENGLICAEENLVNVSIELPREDD